MKKKEKVHFHRVIIELKLMLLLLGTTYGKERLWKDLDALDYFQ
jgi:hypothetical protein